MNTNEQNEEENRNIFDEEISESEHKRNNNKDFINIQSLLNLNKFEVFQKRNKGRKKIFIFILLILIALKNTFIYIFTF